MDILVDDLAGPKIAALIHEHLAAMSAVSPPESKHALAIEALRQPGITFWCAWEGGELVGCGALKQLDSQHGEIKSMRSVSPHQRKGIASALLQHIIDTAKNRGYLRISLETGSMPYFIPARKLYAKFGFAACGPFGDYKEDPHSVFMTRVL